MSAQVTITVSGPCGSGKSALLGEIEIMCKALGLPVSYADEKRAQADKNMNHADWTSELEMYKPSVVLVEDMPWLRAKAPIQATPISSYSEADQAFFAFWYGHMKGDLMTGALADVSHATARYIWDAAHSGAPQGELAKLREALPRFCIDSAGSPWPASHGMWVRFDDIALPQDLSAEGASNG